MLIPCPRCSATLSGGPTCPACGLPLTGPAAAALWQVDQQLTAVDARLTVLRAERQQLWSQHVRLVVELSQRAPVSPRPFVETGALPPVPAPPRPPSWAVDATRQPWTPPPARPRQEWTPRRVQNLLLAIGALLLVIAGAIFTAVSWQHLGAAVRGTILLSLTGAAAIGCRTLARRGLTATAEAVSAVCLGLGVFDCYAFHALVLPRVADAGYWAAAAALLCCAAGGLGRITTVRLPWIAAAVLALLPLVILCTGDLTQADRAVLLSLDALFAACALTALRRAGTDSQTVSDLRSGWLAGGGLLWALGFLTSAAHVLYGLRGESLGAILLAIACTTGAAGLAAWSEGAQQLPNGRPALPILTGAAALSVLCGLSLPFEAELGVTFWALAVIAAALVVLLVSATLPTAWRVGPAVTAAAAAALAGSSELPSVLTTMAGQLDWIDQPWSAGSAVLGRGATLAVAQQWAGAATLLSLVACAGVAAAAGALLGRRLSGLAAAAGLLAVAALVAVPQLGGSYALGLSADLAVAAIAALAAWSLGRRQLAAKVATSVAMAATVLAVSWSLAVPSATAAVAGALVVVLAAAATAGAPYQPVWAGAAVLVSGFGAAAVAHLAGAPLPALGLAVAGVPLAVTAGLAAADRSATVAGQLADALEIAAAVVAVGGLLLAADDGWASWALLAVAGAGLLSTVRASRRGSAPLWVGVALAALTLAPFAQHVGTGPALATCLALTALSVGTTCLLARTPVGQPLAAVLAVGSLVQTVASIVVASDSSPYLTLALALLCLIFSGVATLPDSRLRAAGLHLGYRAAGTGLASALLLAAVAAGCWDKGLAAPTAGLVVALIAAALAAGATQLKDRQPDSLVVELVSVVGALAALRVCADRPVFAGWVLAVGGLTVLLSATRPDRRSSWPVGALLLAAATWVWLAVAGVSAPEPYTDPIAVVALYAGFARRRPLPTTPSLTAYGPGLSGLLLPSLGYAVAGAGLVRPLLLAGLATAVVIVGAQHRLRAPLLLGSMTLVLTALRLVAPYEVLVPRWLEVGAAGALLLMLGATYEQRRRDLGVLRARYDALL